MDAIQNAEDGTMSATEKLALARQILRDFHAQCFWYMREDMDLKPSDIEEIVRGLRQNGGRRGFLLAERLCR
jgi:hypothetical protein